MMRRQQLKVSPLSLCLSGLGCSRVERESEAGG